MRALDFAPVVSAFCVAASVLTPWSAQACEPIPPEAADLLSAQLERALRSGDAAALKALYAADAVIITPAAQRPRDTAPSVTRHLEHLANGLRLTGTPTRTLRMGCNTIVSYGTAEFAGQRAGKTYRFAMRYSRVFERRGGHWRVTLDHMTPSDPLAGANGRVAQTSARPATTPRSVRRRQSSTALDDLVRSVAGELPKPRVAGIVIRPINPGGADEVVLPPPPRLASRPQAIEPSAKVSPATVRVRKARVKKQDWIAKLPGFGGHGH